eukprot:690664-Ditylum_brightwellii.AAC.1
MVLSAIVMGVGGEDITNFVTFLYIPRPKGMGRVSMLRIEDDIAQRMGRYDGHKKFPGEEPLTYNEWLLLPPVRAKKCAAIIVSFNMG